MNAEFMRALDALQTEKNIDKEELVDAIESSIASAYKKNYGNYQDVDVRIDRESGEITLYVNLQVVEEVEDPEIEISLEQARTIDASFEIGDVYRKVVVPKDFGRIAAQNAKQLIVQRIKEAERNMVFNEYLERKDEVLTGTITRSDKGYVRVDIGDCEAVLPQTEQVAREDYSVGKRIKVYVTEVRRTTRGTQITVSRKHTGLVRRLFETEVPEIYDGIVDIVSMSREPGSRTKIAVKGNDPAVDPIGACIGSKGIRVHAIINELNGERMDIVKYSEDPEEYIKNALNPARIERIELNKADRVALVVVDDAQLSVAIGRSGQNVRLAARLTGWRIDLKSSSDLERIIEEDPEYIERLTRHNQMQEQEEDTRSLEEVLDIQVEDNQEDILDDLQIDDADDLDVIF